MSDVVEARQAAAHAAVAYTRQKVRLGSGNKVSMDVARRSYEQSVKSGASPLLAKVKAGVVAVSTSFLAETAVVGMRFKDALENENAGFSLDAVKEISDQTRKSCVGNCSDMASVAFMYLVENAPPAAYPFDLMALTNGKHAFVALGIRVGGSPFIKAKEIEHPSMWGNEVVICDPWNSDAYALQQPGSAMQLLTKMCCDWARARSVFHLARKPMPPRPSIRPPGL